MTQPELVARVEAIKAYAAAQGLRYLPAYARRAHWRTQPAPFEDRPLPAWKAVQLLEAARIVSPGTVEAWRIGGPWQGLADFTWCTACGIEPIHIPETARCAWCDVAPGLQPVPRKRIMDSVAESRRVA